MITFALGLVSCRPNHSGKEETLGSSLESGSQKTSTKIMGREYLDLIKVVPAGKNKSNKWLMEIQGAVVQDRRPRCSVQGLLPALVEVGGL